MLSVVLPISPSIYKDSLHIRPGLFPTPSPKN
jgi:hypothetical protein